MSWVRHNKMSYHLFFIILFKAYYTVCLQILELNSHLSALIWSVMLLSLASMMTVPRPSGIRTFVASIILRMIFSIGPSPTIWLLGFLTVILKGVHIVSLMGNHGTLEKHFLKIITDVQLIYHFGYMVFCMTGMLVHPFFYSVLVISKKKKKNKYCLQHEIVICIN